MYVSKIFYVCKLPPFVLVKFVSAREWALLCFSSLSAKFIYSGTKMLWLRHGATISINDNFRYHFHIIILYTSSSTRLQRDAIGPSLWLSATNRTFSKKKKKTKACDRKKKCLFHCFAQLHSTLYLVHSILLFLSFQKWLSHYASVHPSLICLTISHTKFSWRTKTFLDRFLLITKKKCWVHFLFIIPGSNFVLCVETLLTWVKFQLIVLFFHLFIKIGSTFFSIVQ